MSDERGDADAGRRAVFAGKRALITGGAGFIGSHLARALVALDADVTIVDSLIPEYGGNLFNLTDLQGRVRLNIADVRDEHSMKYLVKSHEMFFNLAGQTSHIDSMSDPYTDLDINCRAQLSMLEACRKENPTIRIVFASTRQIYGKAARLPVDERQPLAPVDVNGINKMAGEWYHVLFSRVYGIPICALRLTNTYGPGMRVKDARQTFLGVWIRRLVDGEPIEVYGDGAQLRDFTFVDDAVDAFLRAAACDRAVGEVFNLGGDERVSLRDLAELAVEVAGQGEIRHVPFPAARKAIDIGDYYADYAHIRDQLGWTPRVALREGLARTIEFYRRHRTHYWA
jgi:UDP-glucose 4-epimerase